MTTLNASEESAINSSSSSSSCGHSTKSWEQSMDQMYTYFYLLLFIPGLLLNTTALWVLCKHISKKTKAVIFMINLALADLAHILSLPLRIYYYVSHSWPFGRGACLFCFYLKYFNMYAAIVFLVCISVQRCVFLLHPFSARRWRRRYDLAISAVVWVVVGVACSPFILMRNSSSSSSSRDLSLQVNLSLPLGAASTQQTFFLHRPTTAAAPPLASNSTTEGCFKDLPTRRLPFSLVVAMIVLVELFGFLIPLACISYSSVRIAWSLNRRRDRQGPAQRGSPPGGRLRPLGPGGRADGGRSAGEKRRALRMVLACCALFLLCFAPYHLNFMLYLMVSQEMLSHCATALAVRQFHPVSLCLAGLSCCLNPLLYYFLTAEFRMHLNKRAFSFSSSLLSSPVNSPTRCLVQPRLMSVESNCSDTRDHRF